MLKKFLGLFLITLLLISGCSPKASTTAAKPLALKERAVQQEADAPTGGEVQIALQNMVYSYTKSSSLTASVLKPDLDKLSKQDWEKNYAKMLKSWDDTLKYANDFSQLAKMIPPATVAAASGDREFQVPEKLVSLLTPKAVYAEGEENELELKSNLDLSEKQQMIMVCNGITGGDKLQFAASHFKTTAQNVKKVMDEHHQSMASVYNMKDQFWGAAANTAQVIDTASDVALFAGDLYTGGGAKFSIAKSGFKSFLKTAVVTSVAGADIVLQIGETATAVGIGDKETTGAWIASARSALSPVTTLISLKNIAQEGLATPGNAKTIVGWGLMYNDFVQNIPANVLKIAQDSQGVSIRGYENNQLSDKYSDEAEISLSARQNLFAKADSQLVLIVLPTLQKLVPGYIGTWEGSVTITKSLMYDQYKSSLPAELDSKLPKPGQTFPLKLVVPQQDLVFDQNEHAVIKGTAYSVDGSAIPVEFRCDKNGGFTFLGQRPAGKFNSGLEAKVGEIWSGTVVGKTAEGTYILNVEGFGGFFQGTWKMTKQD
ncbi:MAG: hypothetical protein GX434_04400 [Peptococcaceae bacterium]|nr:hypothetical protein [Peptococcaceae bacterium]